MSGSFSPDGFGIEGGFKSLTISEIVDLDPREACVFREVMFPSPENAFVGFGGLWATIFLYDPCSCCPFIVNRRK